MGPIVKMKGIVKSFGPVMALRGVDLELRQGEILGLLGDNGAGKSTLIKVLSGLHRPDGGTMEINGCPVDWRRYDVAEARKRGVETVYQERSLGEKQPLWRNVFVGRPLIKGLGVIDVKREKEETMKLLTQVLGLRGVGLRADSPVSILSGGERQGLAIARAMYFQASIIVLDEPTTALDVGEVEKVLRFAETIREGGRSCIIISHELSHLYRVADRFALMEQGTIAQVLDRREVSLERLAKRLMFGKESALS